ncbi:hypothetical protein [Streptomyces sirii]|uniref:hypothetical protein n=1 Tax=Streptomyces sirii TaxID=3127701 RepID=UPI003D36C6BB
MDPELPVVRLCVEGMQAEAEGDGEAALGLFQRAWDIAADDYEACIAAHYLARHQTLPDETLRWNQECLTRADRVGDERVQGFYPSLYVNMGLAYRQLGQPELAHVYFRRAAERAGDAPGGQYGDWSRFAIAEGLRGTASAPSEQVGTGSETGEGALPWALDAVVDGRVRGLLARWCARADLKALGRGPHAAAYGPAHGACGALAAGGGTGRAGQRARGGGAALMSRGAGVGERGNG